MNAINRPQIDDDAGKAVLLDQLQSLIDQTYTVEKEYIALRNSYEQLNRLIAGIIEALPDALWVLNADGSVFLQNSRAEPLDHLILGIDAGRSTFEYQLDRRSFLVKVSRGADKTIVSATEITEQKRQERLISMGQMAAHLAHEIRNPIGSISILLSTLARRAAPKNLPLVEEIKKSLFRVERIIKTTLLFSRGITPAFTRFTLQTLESELKTAAAHYSMSKEVDLRFRLPKSGIRADRNLLLMALQNLLFNALDAIEESDEENGVITLDFEQDVNLYRFTVHDNGLSVEDPSLLFEAFKTTKTRGNGLGLALCMQIARAHHGSVGYHEDPKSFWIALSRTL